MYSGNISHVTDYLNHFAQYFWSTSSVYMVLSWFTISSANIIGLWYIAAHYNTKLQSAQHGKTFKVRSVKLWTHKRHPYLMITTKLWVSIMSYLEESDREILGAYCCRPVYLHYDVMTWEHFPYFWTLIRNPLVASKHYMYMKYIFPIYLYIWIYTQIFVLISCIPC